MKSCEYLLIACLVFTIGCATTMQAYSGPKLPPDKVATIRRSTFSKIVFGMLGARAAESFEVLPDDHTIWVWFRDDFLISEHSCKITFMAKAGHTYEVYGESERRTWHCWVEDMDTAQRTEGIF